MQWTKSARSWSSFNPEKTRDPSGNVQRCEVQVWNSDKSSQVNVSTIKISRQLTANVWRVMPWLVTVHSVWHVCVREKHTQFFPLAKPCPVRNHSCHKLLQLNAIIKWVLPAKWSDWSNKHSNCTLWACKTSAMLYDPWALLMKKKLS